MLNNANPDNIEYLRHRLALNFLLDSSTLRESMILFSFVNARDHTEAVGLNMAMTGDA